jgi:hypothetical protein
MKKIILGFCGFLLLTSFTGCIEIFEDIIFDKNGGGHVQQKMDMSQMADMMASLKGMDKDKKDNKAEPEAESPDGGAAKNMVGAWELLKNIEGITNVNIVQDTIKMIYTVDYDFANETALNKALSKKEDDKGKPEVTYAIGKSSITRSDNDGFGDLLGETENEETAEMMETMLADMKFHLSISVPGKIKSVSNKNAQISSNEKTITLESSLKDLTDKKTFLGMKISYKN